MLPPALKLKVIQQYEAEADKLQKDIAHDLGISTGSVCGILKASRVRQKYEGNSNSNLRLSTLQEQQPFASEESKPEEAIIIGTTTSICNGSPSSNNGDGHISKSYPQCSTSISSLRLRGIIETAARITSGRSTNQVG